MEIELDESKKEIRILLDKIEKVEEINRTLEIQSMSEKKEKVVLQNKLEQQNEETGLLKNTLAKNNEESEALHLQIKQKDEAKEKSNKEEERHNCYKCEFVGNSKDVLKTHMIAMHMKKTCQSME